jgi:hypothetical protein
MVEERLEGDGQEFHKFAPAALTFCSTAPLSELQEVQINGVTIDASNYTTEEGSTVITLPIDYLKTLDADNYEITVVSDSKSAKGGFSVVEPQLNEYGFYYNQPYTAYVDYFGCDFVFFMRDDGTVDVIALDGGTEVCTYTTDGNNIVVNSPSSGTLNCTVSSNGMEIYCNELSTNFVLGDTSVVADEDYIYVYKEDLGGYEVTAINKTKAEYGAIKTGINGMNTVKLADNMFTPCDADGNITYNTTLVKVPKIPNSVITIGKGVFRGCNGLTSAVISDGVIVIGQESFLFCENLTTIVISDSVTNIQRDAFAYSNALNSITFNGTIAQWNAITKGSNWNYNVPATHVHCSDGDAAL